MLAEAGGGVHPAGEAELEAHLKRLQLLVGWRAVRTRHRSGAVDGGGVVGGAKEVVVAADEVAGEVLRPLQTARGMPPPGALRGTGPASAGVGGGRRGVQTPPPPQPHPPSSRPK